ncbi:MAG: hypothetical protein ACSHX0_06290 [Akkermansiaceae bacterium]
MKHKLLITTIVSITALSSVLHAQKEPRDGGDHKKAAMMWFDADGDGTLSDTEKESMKQAMEARKARILANFDADNDGELSDAEKEAAKTATKAKHEAIRAAILAKFDADSDGKLSKEERVGVKEWIASEYPEEIPFPLANKKEKGSKGGGKKKSAE